MKRFLLLNILTFNVLFAFSQITIRGTVTECTTNEGLPGANVRLTRTNFGAITNFDGNFEISIRWIRNDSINGYTVKNSYTFFNEIRTIETSYDCISDFLDKINTISFHFLGFVDEIRAIEISDDNCSDKIYTINVCLVLCERRRLSEGTPIIKYKPKT